MSFASALHDYLTQLDNEGDAYSVCIDKGAEREVFQHGVDHIALCSEGRGVTFINTDEVRSIRVINHDKGESW